MKYLLICYLMASPGNYASYIPVPVVVIVKEFNTLKEARIEQSKIPYWDKQTKIIYGKDIE